MLVALLAGISCKGKIIGERPNDPVLEVAGRFLYQSEIDKVVPPGSSVIDSADIADRYIRKWVTETLMYENARRNLTDMRAIDELVDAYRRSLVIHEYEQALVEQRVETTIDETEIQAFYNTYKSEMTLDDNMVKGLLLVLPKDAPQLTEVTQWVRHADTQALENLEQYSLQNAISFDYFTEWTPFSQILKQTPFTSDNPKDFVMNTRFTETTDSTRRYLLHITQALPAGATEPYEVAKERITNAIVNKKKTNFIIELEKSIYNDALQQGEINFIKKQP